MKIYELVIEPGREEHIARHQVSVSEVEEVIFSTPFIRKARQGRYHIIGQTESGRYLTIFVAPRGHGVYGLVTARDSDDAEHICDTVNTNAYDKQKTRTAKKSKEPHTYL